MTLTEQFKELPNLDPQKPGTWPILAHALVVVVAFVLVLGGGVYMYVVKEKMPKLERAQAEEQQLRNTFEQKQRKAANLQAYKDQLEEMRRSFGGMLRQLPGKTEIEDLIVDVSQTGLASGLEQELFRPQSEVAKQFYAEKPIQMRLTGRYHQFGEFVSGVAALPRIVTLHDIEIRPKDRGADSDELQLSVTAKTYRYLEGDDEGSS